ncbi:hypothetical protein Clacol_008733 [Clathrus columnatus]|uniref:Uncharacterized protein n=1 Tax=Clathrus columnatus TaxID=1419009 RepID=A0AAV5AP59_9AGAM|nr:hypothetical protein Clacol_008733 [Clathrus columnatus]
MTLALSITFLTAVILQFYDSHAPFFIRNGAIVISDVLAFIGQVHQAWGVWKLKKSVGLQSNGDIATIILKQGILRVFDLDCECQAGQHRKRLRQLPKHFPSFRISLLLICEFTLDLRRRNTINSISNPSALDLPTISFGSTQNDPVQSIRRAGVEETDNRDLTEETT